MLRALLAAAGAFLSAVALAAASDDHDLSDVKIGANVTIVDLKTLKPIGTAATGENPDSIRYDAVSGRVFAFNGRSKSGTVIDAKSGSVVATAVVTKKHSLGPCEGPSGLAIDLKTRRLFDPGTGFAFSSNGDGTLTIVRQIGSRATFLPDTFKVLVIGQ